MGSSYELAMSADQVVYPGDFYEKLSLDVVVKDSLEEWDTSLYELVIADRPFDSRFIVEARVVWKPDATYIPPTRLQTMIYVETGAPSRKDYYTVQTITEPGEITLRSIWLMKVVSGRNLSIQVQQDCSAGQSLHTIDHTKTKVLIQDIT